MGTDMLRLLGSHYHFRRTIPLTLRPLLGRTEISLSLQMSSKRVARERAAGRCARTGLYFSKAKAMYEDASPGELRTLETRKNRVISGEAGWLDDVEVLRGAPRASFGPISTMPGVDSAGFADLQTALAACRFQTLVEDQPIEVVGQVAKGQFRLSAGEADGADEQVEPVLLMREDMLNMRTDRGFGGIGPSGLNCPGFTGERFIQ